MPEERKNSGAGGHSYGHRHHHRRSLKHRFKRWLLRHKGIFVALLVILVAVIVGWYPVRRDMVRQAGYRIDAGELTDVDVNYRSIVYDGKNYRYNSRVTTILYAGVDSRDPLGPSTQYAAAPCADSILLVVMDDLNRRTTIMALDCDTMTAVRRYAADGSD